MPFPLDKVADLLVACHRRCCICHVFCGVKIETDHIVPRGEGGSDEIDNAIPVCFDCHAEIHSYNDQHPRGRKFRADELRLHKQEWLRICREHPEIFVAATREQSVGPLQSLIDELEFNRAVVEHNNGTPACLFANDEFKRAIREGAISVLKEDIKKVILDAYVMMGRANQAIQGITNHQPGSNAWAEATNSARDEIVASKERIALAYSDLVSFLSSEPDAAP